MPVQVLRRRPSPARPRPGSARGRRSPSRCRRSYPSSHQPSRTLTFGDAVLGRLHARRARRLERPARVVQPDVDALDEEPADAHVVVLEDEDAAAKLGERERWKISWMTRCPGRSAGWALPGEDDLDRAVRVPQQPRQPVDVGEQQTGALVRREPSGEADREDRGSRAVSTSARTDGRLAVARELAAQPAAGEDRELALLAQVGLPQVVAPGCVRAAPRSGPGAARRRARRGPRRDGGRAAPHRRADPCRPVDAVRDAEDRRGRSCPPTSRWRSRRGAC